MITKTSGIVLRTHPVSNTSRIIVWLTQEHGQIHTMVKGALRPKSMFLGQFDLFYTCELLFYSRENRNLYIARECYPLQVRQALRTDWRATAAASYFCDLIRRITLQRAPAQELYHLLNETLDILSQHGCPIGFIYWFELKVLQQIGLAPRLSHCMVCDKVLNPGDRKNRFSYSEGGMLCQDHASTSKGQVLPVSPDALALLISWQKAQKPRTVFNTKLRSSQEEAVRKILGLFLQYHLELAPTARGIALDLLHRVLPKQ